jgi:acetolactate decarboxylase
MTFIAAFGRIRACFAIALAMTLVGGCADRRGPVVYQNSTIEALLDGNYDGDVTFTQLREHGDFGLGTLNALDGEMLAIGGRFFQVRSDGHVLPVDDAARTPFSAVTFFRPSATATLGGKAGSLDYKELEARLDRMRTSDGRAFAFAVEGHFSLVRTRSVPRQAPPYRPLVDVVKGQSVFDLKDISGTLVGFWFPQSMKSVNVPGYHFHFVTADRSAGGHVLELSMLKGTAQMMELSTVEINLPKRAPTTRPSTTVSPSTELDAVEK